VWVFKKMYHYYGNPRFGGKFFFFDDQDLFGSKSCSYFDKMSESIISRASLISVWSGYNNGRAQKSLNRIIAHILNRKNHI